MKRVVLHLVGNGFAPQPVVRFASMYGFQELNERTESDRHSTFVVIELDIRPEKLRHLAHVTAVIRVPKRRVFVPDGRVQGGLLVLGKYRNAIPNQNESYDRSDRQRQCAADEQF